nr:glycosyltransferase 87 family protein [Streptomyces meridianus]
MLAVSLALFAALLLLRHAPMADLFVYRAEGAAVLSGDDPYGFTVTRWDLPATYPPFAAILFVPAALAPPAVLKVCAVAANLALLVLLVRLSLDLAGVPRAHPLRPAAICAGAALALWLEPVFQTLIFGQINLVLACLVLWDAGRPDGARGKGLATGLAAGIKITPAVFVLFLLVTGRRRAGLAALAAFAGSVLAGALALPAASHAYWTGLLFDTGRVGKVWIVDNQSLHGLMGRLLHRPDAGAAGTVAAVLVVIAGLAVARRVTLRGRPEWGLLCAALTGLLVSPISWSHHWVWCVPLLALLSRRRAVLAAVAVVFTARSMWLLPHRGDLDLRLPWWQQPLAAPYPLLGLAVLAAVAARQWRAHRRGGRDGVAVASRWSSRS